MQEKAVLIKISKLNLGQIR